MQVMVLKSGNYLLRVIVSCLLIAGVLSYLLNSLGSSLQQQQQVLPMQHTIIFRAWLTRVKNAVRMRAFPASGANLPVEIIRDTKTN